MKDGKTRKDIQVGMHVSIVLKQDQRSGKLTEGIVQTQSSPNHRATPMASKCASQRGKSGVSKSSMRHKLQQNAYLLHYQMGFLGLLILLFDDVGVYFDRITHRIEGILKVKCIGRRSLVVQLLQPLSSL
jgi:uncharacterized protein YwbE